MERSMIGRNILVIDKYSKLFLKNAVKEYGLNCAECMALLALYGEGAKTDDEILVAIPGGSFGKTQEQIIDEIHYDKGVMARTMQTLENKGYVFRNANPNDNRSYVFTMTEQAQAFMPKLFEILRDWTDRVLSNVENIEIVQRALAVMAENGAAAA